MKTGVPVLSFLSWFEAARLLLVPGSSGAFS